MEPSELLPELIRILEGLGLRYFITGSTATILYGEPRFTNDIDVVVELPPARIDEFCGAFPAPLYYCSRSAVIDAVKQAFQFNILSPATGMKVDVIVASNSDYDQIRLQRTRRIKNAAGTEGAYAAPEDVIVMKMVYFREGGSEKHLRDITGMLKTCSIPIDRDYVAKWAESFGCGDIWERILERASQANP